MAYHHHGIEMERMGYTCCSNITLSLGRTRGTPPALHHSPLLDLLLVFPHLATENLDFTLHFGHEPRFLCVTLFARSGGRMTRRVGLQFGTRGRCVSCSIVVMGGRF